jgi:DNA-binding response OmpR family regulator
MLVFVDDLNEAARLTPVLRRAGYQVIIAEDSSDIARWADATSVAPRAVIGLRSILPIASLSGKAPASSVLKSIAANIHFDALRQIVIVDQETRALTLTEARLLQALFDHANRPLSRAQLIDLVWGYDYAGHEREVDVYIRYLRRKIEPDPAQPRYIITIRGLGYLLDVHNGA